MFKNFGNQTTTRSGDIQTDNSHTYFSAYGAPADECPHNLGKSDLYTYGNFCLKVHYGNYDWVDARHQCQKEGGDLIQIRDSGMQQFLQRVLSGQRSEDTGFWIGASDSESESHWKWVAGKVFLCVLRRWCVVMIAGMTEGFIKLFDS